MVAPAGVNEEAPREPGEPAAASGGKPAETTSAETDADLAGEDGAEAKPAAGDATGAGPAESEHAEAGTGGPDRDAGQESRDISPLAVAGIILGVIALVGAAVGVLAVLTHGFRTKTVVTYRPAAVFGLRPGECINSGASVLNVTVVSCATAHDAEVFARFSLPATG
jgi:hypothetical protein